MYKYLFFLVGILFLASCQDRPIYSKTLELENAQWVYGDSLDFDFAIRDTTQRHDLILRVTHDRAYPAQNFYAKFLTRYPNQRSVEDVVSIELSDNYGKWLGKCRGEKCTTDILLQSRVRFQELGGYKISIQQHTRNAVLKGIEALEFRLMKITE